MAQQSLSGPLSGFLERFRGTSGIPAAVGGDVASELAPVFSALDEIERESTAVRVKAESKRVRRQERLERELAAIAAEAHQQAERAREQAATAVRQAAETEAAAVRADGDRAAEAIRGSGRPRVAPLVAAVVAQLAEAGR